MKSLFSTQYVCDETWLDNRSEKVMYEKHEIVKSRTDKVEKIAKDIAQKFFYQCAFNPYGPGNQLTCLWRGPDMHIAFFVQDEHGTGQDDKTSYYIIPPFGFNPFGKERENRNNQLFNGRIEVSTRGTHVFRGNPIMFLNQLVEELNKTDFSQ